ncbi:hypothetical protein DY000_02017652 [Brassica cretica]|uniref:ATPase AAA-type core domain-containing protein n=1 Tax=Brassica cretica TaxID=69181 RepID=A0ABQ7D7P6_BRACR|nr:hypothetical protein DY000_02017652 [Brassica cretica]
MIKGGFAGRLRMLLFSVVEYSDISCQPPLLFQTSLVDNLNELFHKRLETGVCQPRVMIATSNNPKFVGDSLEDLLDVMAVGNPVMQRMLSERRAALGMPPRDPQESDPTRQQPSNPTNYFDNM